MKTLIKAAIRIIITIGFIWMFISLAGILSSSASVVSQPRFSHDPLSYWFIILPLAILLALAAILIILWRKSDWLVAVLAGNINETELVISTTNLDLITVVLRILGICLVLTSLPALAGQLTSYGIMKDLFPSPLDYQARMIENLVKTGGTILIGAWLLFGGKGIVETVNRQVSPDNKNNMDDAGANE